MRSTGRGTDGVVKLKSENIQGSKIFEPEVDTSKILSLLDNDKLGGETFYIKYVIIDDDLCKPIRFSVGGNIIPYYDCLKGENTEVGGFDLQKISPYVLFSMLLNKKNTCLNASLESGGLLLKEGDFGIGPDGRPVKGIKYRYSSSLNKENLKREKCIAYKNLSAFSAANLIYEACTGVKDYYDSSLCLKQASIFIRQKSLNPIKPDNTGLISKINFPYEGCVFKISSLSVDSETSYIVGGELDLLDGEGLRYNPYTDKIAPLKGGLYFAVLCAMLNFNNICTNAYFDSDGIHVDDTVKIVKSNLSKRIKDNKKCLEYVNAIYMAYCGKPYYDLGLLGLDTPNNSSIGFKVSAFIVDNRKTKIGVVLDGGKVLSICEMFDMLIKGNKIVSKVSGNTIKIDRSKSYKGHVYLCYDGVNGGCVDIDDIPLVNIVQCNIDSKLKANLVMAYERKMGVSLGEALKRQLGVVK